MEALRLWLRGLAEAGVLPEFLAYGFVVNALVCALLIGPVLGGLGTLVVTRRLAFFSQAVGHAAMTGVALGIVLGEPPSAPYVSLFAFCLLFALLLNHTRRRSALATDTVIAVFLSVSLAVGACLLLAVSTRADGHLLESILFGSVLTVDDGDIAVLAAIAAVALAAGLPLFNRLMVASFSPGIARVRGVPVVVLDYAFVLLVALVTVASVKIIGAVLIEALLVIPAAVGRNVARSLRGFVGWSTATATASALLGIVVPLLFDWPLPTGGAIILAAAALFVLSLVVRALRAS